MRVVSGGNAPVTTFASGPSLSRARYEVLMRLTHADAPSTIVDLEQSTGRHANTLREHADALVRSGLVRRVPGSPRGPGRPALRYTALSVDEIRADYPVLAADLVELVARQARQPGPEAEEAGVRWGIHLARETSPPSTDAALEGLLRLLEALGFQVPHRPAPPVTATWAGWDDALAWRVHLGVARGAWTQWEGPAPAPRLRAPSGGEGPRLVLE